MKICLMGSAPSSVALAPFGDPSWQIWGCSPGLYPSCPRVDAWFEMHRWEPPVIGKPGLQVPWFSPEYVAWMAQQKKVWMYAAVPEIPNSDAYPVAEMEHKFGTFFWTSSLAWMAAMAIDQILADREARAKSQQQNTEPDQIAFFGVDMAANEEYGYQRAGCQYFACLAHTLGIQVVVPPESDLMRPMPRYGIDESAHWMIKFTKRKAELTARLNAARAAKHNAELEEAALMGAIDDLEYHMKTWGADRDGLPTNPAIYANSPIVRELVKQDLARESVGSTVQPA